MNTEILQIISVIAFSLSGIFAALSVILFFKMDVRGIWNDLSGKSAERQIREFRERNKRREAGRSAEVLFERQNTSGVPAEDSKNSRQTLKLQRAEEETLVLSAAGEQTTEELKENSAVEENETTVLAREESASLPEQEPCLGMLLGKGYSLVLNEIIIHTKERI